MATDLGQAYVQIVPSARGIGGSISSIMNPEATSAGASSGQSFGKSMLAAMGIAKIASVATNAIKGSIDGAISRFDTLSNSARVFENMGFGAKETSKTMDDLKKSIQGLPTPLDGAVKGVQLIASSTGDLGKSRKLFESLNNGILGFGGSTAQVDNAVTQLSQAFSNGKVDAGTWNSMINSGLGPALNALAKTMGKTTGELKSGLSDGSISVEQFQEALINLNENGGGGLKSLKTISKDAMSGIGTGFANMKTAVVRGVANVIGKLDELSKAFTGKSIGENITVLSSMVDKIFTDIVSSMDGIIPVFNRIKEALQPVGEFVQTALVPAFSALVGKFGELAGTTVGVAGDFIKWLASPGGELARTLLTGLAVAIGIVATAFGIYNVVMGIATAITGAFTAVMAVLTSPITLVIVAIAALVAAGIMLYNHWDEVKAKATEVWNSILNTISGVWNGIISSVSSAINAVSSTVSNVFNSVLSVVQTIWNGIKSAITTPIEAAKNTVQSVIDGIKNILTSIGNVDLMGAGRAIIDGFVGGLKGAWEKGKEFVSGIGDWIKEHKGPIEYDRKLLIPAGNAIMNGLNSGLQDRFKDVKSTISGMADSMRDSFNVGQMINDELASVSNSDLQAKLYSGQNLVKQVIDGATGQTSNADVLRAIKGMSDRPIVVSNQVDSREFSRLTAQPMNEEIDLYQRQRNRMAGILI